MDTSDNNLKCANCAAVGGGAYCQICGQKRVHDGDLSLRHAFHYIAHEALHFDGRIVNTLKLLFTRPGQLTVDFLEGRRLLHVNPVRLFLIFSALYFVTEGTAKSSGIAKASGAVTKAMTQLQREHIEAYGQLAFKVAFIGSVLVNGLILWAVFRKQRTFIAEHMVTALHLSCVTMAFTIVLGTVGRWFNVEAMLAGVAALVFVPFAQFSVRHVYQDKVALKSALCTLLMYFADLAIVIGTTLLAVRLAAG